MKKLVRLCLAVLLLVAIVMTFAACAKEYEVTWQSGSLYTIQDEDGNALTGTSSVEDGTELKFKIVPNTLVEVSKVMAGNTALVADANGVYTVKVEANVTIAATAIRLDNKVTSIAVTTQPTKTVYNVGETFDNTGMVVTATYLDGTTAAVTSYVAVYQSGTAFASGDSKVTISYTDEFNTTVSVDVTVTVNDVTLQSIMVSGTLTNSKYVADATLSGIEGLTVKAIYSDESEATLTFNQLTVVYATANATSFSMGDTSFTLKYGDKTAVVNGITVREFEAYQNISVDLSADVDGKILLIVTGELKDATSAKLFVGNSEGALAEVDATVNESAWNASIVLSTALQNATAGTWYDLKVYYAADKYIDLKDTMCEEYSKQMAYQGKCFSFQQWNHDLKICFQNYVTRNVIASLAADANEKPILTVSGEYGILEALGLYIGGTKCADAVLNSANHTFSVSVDLAALIESMGENAQANNPYAVTLVGVAVSNAITIDAPATLNKVTYGDYDYSLASVGGNLAVKYIPEGLTIAATLSLVEGEPVLTIVGTTEAAAVSVRFNGVEKAATVSDGQYTVALSVKNIVIPGHKYVIEVKEGEGNYEAFVAAEVASGNPLPYRLTTAPRHDMYAVNTYAFETDNSGLTIAYEQSTYLTDGDTLVSTIKALYFAEGKMCIVYPESINTWGALKKGDWTWFSDPIETEGVIRTRTANLADGLWSLEYTVGALNNMDDALHIVYDGEFSGSLIAQEDYGYYIANGQINICKNYYPYTATIAVALVEEEVVVTVTGSFESLPADVTGFGVHCWYGEGINFDGSIQSDGTFTYTYTLAAEPKKDTLWMHMLTPAESNLKGTIEGESTLIYNGYAYTINRSDSGDLSVVVDQYRYPYNATASLATVGNEVVLTITGTFTDIPTDTTGFGVHCWYGESINFDGSIQADGTFTYTYTFAASPKKETMYLHMLDSGDEINLKGTIAEDASTVTLGGITYTINRGNDGVLTVVVADEA